MLQFSVTRDSDTLQETHPLLYYEIRENDGKINKGFTAIIIDDAETGFNLSQNFPNPVIRSFTKIKVNLHESEHILLKVYDISGNLIEVLLNKKLDAGEHIIEWDTKGLKPGIYYYKLLSSKHSFVRKCLIIN